MILMASEPVDFKLTPIYFLNKNDIIPIDTSMFYGGTMDTKEIRRALLNSLPYLDHRNWESPEKNNLATGISKRIRVAVETKDTAELERLIVEIKHFTAPSFTLHERIRGLTLKEIGRKWATEADSATWNTLIARATIIIRRNDTEELKQIAERLITFLRARNGHILARSLEDALNIARKRW